MKVKANCTINATKVEVFNAFSDLKNLANNVRAIKGIELSLCVRIVVVRHKICV